MYICKKCKKQRPSRESPNLVIVKKRDRDYYRK